MNQHIIFAIRSKHVLRLQYKSFVRIVEPHAFGFDTNGVAMLRCFQTAGGSTANAPADWKMLDVAEILGLELTGETFNGPRPGYKFNDEAMVKITAQIQAPGLADWRG